MSPRVILTALVCALALPAGAPAAELDDPVAAWLPSSDTAEWTYSWTDSAYSPTPRTERFTVASRSGNAFQLRWEEPTPPADATASSGTMDFQRTGAGLVNLNYQSSQPPPSFPILCSSPTGCGNSLAGTYHMLVWGTRSPVLAEPLLKGTRWSSLGGARNDVSSENRYLGTTSVKVPAFPDGVTAAVVQSTITQAGAIGDPYGSGVRTVFWVYGVGPVRVVFSHAGGETTQSDLVSTTLAPLPAPPDADWFPLAADERSTFRWRNSRHMRRWSVQRFTVAQVVNGSARVDVKSVRGPIKVAGSYVFSKRLDGITNLSASTKAATRRPLPKLGPRSVPPADRRHFFTPYDLMTFGFNPVLPVFPAEDASWRSSRESRDWTVYGASGVSTILEPREVRTPAGRFLAYGVRTRLLQAGFPFGSGTRTSWFAAGEGLVKLVFRHADRSVSTVERTS